MINIYTTDQQIVNAIEAQIKENVEAAFDKIIEDAKDRLEKQLRKDLAQNVMSIHKKYSVEWREEEIIIRVDNKGETGV